MLARYLIACGQSHGVWSIKCTNVLGHGFWGSGVMSYLFRCVVDLDGVIDLEMAFASRARGGDVVDYGGGVS